jgi:hypothetical protein
MSLVATRLENFRPTADVDKWEVRAQRVGALEAFKRQTEDPNGIISDDLQNQAIAAVGSTLEVPVLDFESTTISNVTQPVAIVGDPSTSALYAVTFTDYYFGFRIFPAQHANNDVKIQREFNRQMMRYVYQLLDDLDQAAIAALEAAKTQVLANDLGGRYSLTSNVIVAPLAEQNAIVGDINPLMGGNKFYGPFDFVCNPGFESHVRNNLLEKGEFNSDDKRYQYNDKTWFFTNNIANGVGHKATGYAIQSGSVGILSQFLPDNVMRSETHKHRWDIELIPGLNMQMGVYQYDDAVDASALNASTTHLTASKMEAYGFHARWAFLTPYNSDAANIASAIGKVAIATT